MREAILRTAASAQSPATRRAYDSSWRRFENWCAAHHYQPLPARPEVIAAYLVDAAETVDDDGRHAYAPATLTKWLAAIADRHRRCTEGFDPCVHPLVRSTVSGIRREYAAAGDRPRRPREPLLTDDVLELVSAARDQVRDWSDAVGERRDSALIMVGFAGAFRRSELVALTGADVELHPLDGLHVHVRRSKTDQQGDGRVHALPRSVDPRRCPPCAFARWAQVVAAFDREGRPGVIATLDPADVLDEHLCRQQCPEISSALPVFRAISGKGQLSVRALSGSAVHAAVRRRAIRAGYSEAAVARLGAHSLRAGFVTQAFRNGADAVAIMRQTDHRSATMVARYARERAPLIGNAVTELGL